MRRLGDCLAYRMYLTIPPSFSFENATSLYTREAFCCELRIISRQPPLASPLGERWHAKRDGEGCSYSSPASPHGRQIAAPTTRRKIVPTSLPPSDEGGVTVGDGGREKQRRNGSFVISPSVLADARTAPSSEGAQKKTEGERNFAYGAPQECAADPPLQGGKFRCKADTFSVKKNKNRKNVSNFRINVIVIARYCMLQ